MPSVVNIDETLEGHPPRTNFHIIRLDDKYTVRVAEIVDRFPWHRHTNGDEGWLVWSGKMRIDIEGGGSVTLGRGDTTVIPRGVRHSPICLEEGTRVVVFNVVGFDHEFVEADPDVGTFKEVG